jgi:adenosylhomocysteine nucleosidase
VFVGGGGSDGAAAAARQAVQAGALSLISFGLAGGLDPALPAGTIIVPRQVIRGSRRYAAAPELGAALGGFTHLALLAGDTVVPSAEAKARLFSRWHASAVDLESGPVAEAAAAAGAGFAVLRAICDPADRDLPPAALAALDADGRIRIGRLLRALSRRPGQFSQLLTLGQDAARARRALAERVATLRGQRTLQREGE